MISTARCQEYNRRPLDSRSILLFEMTVPSCSSWILLLMWTVLVSGCQDVPAQDSGGVVPSEQASYDVTYYDLSVTVQPGREAIAGRLRVQADIESPLEVFVLNLDRRLSVTNVWANEVEGQEPLSRERRAGKNELWITLPNRKASGTDVDLTVAYEGTPRKAPNPPWEGGFTWAETPEGDPWIATSGQTSGADLWWPVKDHPSDEPDSMDIAVTVPDSLVAASNGVLQNVTRESDSTETYQWHVSTSINSYGVTLNVAPYSVIDTSYASTAGTRVPVLFYVLPSDTGAARSNLPHFLRHVRYLEETLGPYPFRADKYGIAQTPFLGMEHQTLIAYGNDFGRTGGLGYRAKFDALHFHELAHEWYGNCVTVRDWKDFWIHEGTATYLEALYTESRRGNQAYHERIGYFRDQLANETSIARRSPTSAQDIYGRDVYYKGALVLHTLRSMIGADAVQTLLRRFVSPDSTEEPVCRHVDTDAFLGLAESISGRDLDGFADIYLYEADLPRLDTTRTETALRLRWTNTGDASFEVPVPVAVGDSVRHVSMSEGRGEFRVPDDAAVRIDPEGWVLRANAP